MTASTATDDDRRPLRLRGPIVSARALAREYLIMAAIAAVTVAVAIEEGGVVAIGIAIVSVAFLAVVGLAATPASNRLIVDRDGLHLRLMLVFDRTIPWSAIGAIDVVEGWSGETVAIDVAGPAGEGIVLGLPIDPALRRRCFVSTYGHTPAVFRDLLIARRDAAHP